VAAGSLCPNSALKGPAKEWKPQDRSKTRPRPKGAAKKKWHTTSILRISFRKAASQMNERVPKLEGENIFTARMRRGTKNRSAEARTRSASDARRLPLNTPRANKHLCPSPNAFTGGRRLLLNTPRAKKCLCLKGSEPLRDPKP